MLEEDQRQLDRAVRLVRDVFGPDVVGAYLFGSAASGRLRPRSDLDVLVATRRPTSREEKRRLVESLLSISGRRTEGGRWRRVELTVVVESDVNPWRYPPRFDFQYGDWLRREFESGTVEPWPTTTNPDLATLLTMVLLADRPLLGPPPADVFEPVPHGDLVRALVDSIEPLLDDLESDTANVILTMARIWTTVTTGEIRSKDAAADWALERLGTEHHAVLLRAREIYLGNAEDSWADLEPRVRPHVDHVVDQIFSFEESTRAQRVN